MCITHPMKEHTFSKENLRELLVLEGLVYVGSFTGIDKEPATQSGDV